MKAILGVALVLATVEYCPGCVPDGPPPCIDRVGFPVREIPDVDMRVGETMEQSLKGHFSLPPECVAEYSHPDYAIFEVTSSDSAAVAVSMADLTTVEIVALEVTESVRVTVVGVDHDPGHSREFLVRVRAR